MKKPLWLDIFREIRRSFARFVSIMAIVALGVAFFIGIRAAGPSMLATSQVYFKENHLPHGQVLGTYGLDQDDLDLLKETKLEWLPLKTVKVSLKPGDFSTKLYPMAKEEDKNFFKVTKGRFPKNKQEIAIDNQVLSIFQDQTDASLALGDWVSLKNKEEDSVITLQGHKFQVVGFIESPIYFERTNRGNEAIDLFALVNEEVIQGDIYTEAYFWRPDLSQSLAYQPNWEKALEESKEDILKLIGNQGQVKLAKLTEEAQKEIADQQAEIDQAYLDLDEGRKQLIDKRSDLDSASQELAEGERKLAQAKEEYQQGLIDYHKGLSLFESGSQEIANNEARLQAGQASYEAGLAQYEQGQNFLSVGLGSMSQELVTQISIFESESLRLSQYGFLLESGQALLDFQQEVFESIILDRTGLEQLSDLLVILDSLSRTSIQAQSKLDELSSQLEDLPEEEDTHLSEIEDKELERQSLVDEISALLDEELWSDETGSQEAPIDRREEIDRLLEELLKLDQGLIELYEQYQENLDLESQGEQLRSQFESWQDVLSELVLESDYFEPLWQAIESGQAKFYDEVQQLASNFIIYESALTQLESASKVLEDAQESLDYYRKFGPSNLESARQELESVKQQLEDGQNKINQAKQELLANQETLYQAEQALIQGQASLEEGIEDLDSAMLDYSQGKYDFDSASIEFENMYKQALSDLESGQKEIDQARQNLKDLLSPEFITRLSQDQETYRSVRDNAEQLSVIANIFPVFFLFIAGLVTFTTVKRMTTEQRNFMGTLKQMGFPDMDILKKFISYAGLASVLGIGLGLWLGYLIFPKVILSAYNIMFLFDQPVIVYSWQWMVIIASIALATGLIPAIHNPKMILQESPASLLRPPAPVSGKKILLERIPFFWKVLSFKQKMTLRNLFRYKGRNLMTLIGVAGGTMLIVTGYGISDTISGILDQQFNKIQSFDSLVLLNDQVNQDQVQEVIEFLDQEDRLQAYIPIFQTSIETNVEGITNQAVNLIVPMDEDQLNFDKYIHLHQRKTPEQREGLEEGKIYISERLEEFVDSQKTGSLPIIKDHFQRELPISSVIENYIGHYIYMNHKDYLTYFFEEPQINSFYLAYQDGNHNQVKDQLSQMPQVLTVIEIKDLAAGIQDSLGSLDLITIVLIISAAGLAFVVLYNLTNINIEERMKELATIKVLGFYSLEVSLYIYSEVLILTLLGSLLGLVFGYYLTSFLMKTMQMNNVLFYPKIHWQSYLVSFLLTFVFSGIVMSVMHRKIARIDMVEALKAQE